MTASYRSMTIDGVRIFYREAGDPSRPTLLLLHGFPTASHMFRDLIPLLEGSFHLIAPDLPGFGQSDMPPREDFAYTFDQLAGVMQAFVRALGLTRFALYVFDYGAPIGFRMALEKPSQVTAIISQNGNVYGEGLSEGFAPLRAYWAEPDDQTKRDALRALLTPQMTYFQYSHGAPDASRISPDSYTLDDTYLARPGAVDVQLDLFRDYETNVQRYPAFQAYLRQFRPPLLAIWGRNDPFFRPEGALAYRRDVPDAEVHLLDAGHFALETHAGVIAARILDFLGRCISSDPTVLTHRRAGAPDRAAQASLSPAQDAPPTPINND